MRLTRITGVAPPFGGPVSGPVPALPYEALGGLIGRSMSSDVWQAGFAAKLQAGVPRDRVPPKPYATVEAAGQSTVAAVLGRRYKILREQYIVTVVCKDSDDIGIPWRALEQTFGEFAMKGNRIPLRYGEIISTVIENERFSPSTETDKNNDIVRWKKANLIILYTKRL
jgi:hypothetical protein